MSNDLKADAILNDKPLDSESDRANLLTSIQDQISNYFLEHAKSQPWEYFDGDLDSIRAQVQSLIT